CVFYCFFFQAEDGIRDPLVTGVQTCALPIFCVAAKGDNTAPMAVNHASHRPLTRAPYGRAFRTTTFHHGADRDRSRGRTLMAARSEERRVGKECGGRATRCHCEERRATGAVE